MQNKSQKSYGVKEWIRCWVFFFSCTYKITYERVESVTAVIASQHWNGYYQDLYSDMYKVVSEWKMDEWNEKIKEMWRRKMGIDAKATVQYWYQYMKPVSVRFIAHFFHSHNIGIGVCVCSCVLFAFIHLKFTQSFSDLNWFRIFCTLQKLLNCPLPRALPLIFQ